MRTWSRWRSLTSLWTASSTPAGDPCASAPPTTVVGAPGGGSARSLMANKNSTPSAVLIVLVCGYGDVGKVYAYSSRFVLCVLCRLRCIRQCHVYGWYCWYFSPCGRGVSFVVVRPLVLRIKAGMYQKDSDAGLVLLSALCFLLLSSDPDVRHLGRYGPEGQVCSTGCGRARRMRQWHI